MRLTLLTDGSTDIALCTRILRWLLAQHSTKPFEQNWADLRRLREKPQRLVGRVSAALDLYPCEICMELYTGTRSGNPQRIACGR